MGNTAAQSPKPPANPKSELGEAEFLKKQAEDATAAMTAVVHGLADSLKDAANPASWTREHPWPSLGAAAVLGFVAASAMTPSKGQTWKERFESLFPDAGAPGGGFDPAMLGNYSTWAAQQHQAGPQARKPSKLMAVAAPVLDMLKTALMTSISSALATKAAQDAPPSDNSESHATDPTAHV